jgi:hypothetical protein
MLQQYQLLVLNLHCLIELAKANVAHWFGCVGGKKFQRSVFSKYLGQWWMQIHRIIIDHKLNK